MDELIKDQIKNFEINVDVCEATMEAIREAELKKSTRQKPFTFLIFIYAFAANILSIFFIDVIINRFKFFLIEHNLHYSTLALAFKGFFFLITITLAIMLIFQITWKIKKPIRN